MSLAPVPGPLSIATGTVIVEVLVGWSPALQRRFLPEAAGVRADFLHIKKKKKKIYQLLKIHDNINKPKYQMVRSYIKFKINLQAEHTKHDSERAHYYKRTWIC